MGQLPSYDCFISLALLPHDAVSLQRISDIMQGTGMLLMQTFHLPSTGYIQSRRRQADGHLPGERGADPSRCRPDFPALPPRALLSQKSHPPATLA